MKVHRKLKEVVQNKKGGAKCKDDKRKEKWERYLANYTLKGVCRGNWNKKDG